MNTTYYGNKAQDGRSDDGPNLTGSEGRASDIGKQIAGPHVGQFGEFDETGIGTDLTLEWDSTDPGLHARLAQDGQIDEDDAENHSWHRDDMGIPDG